MPYYMTNTIWYNMFLVYLYCCILYNISKCVEHNLYYSKIHVRYMLKYKFKIEKQKYLKVTVLKS